MHRRLRLKSNIPDLPQSPILLETHSYPEGTGVNSYEQIDDICVMGIRA